VVRVAIPKRGRSPQYASPNSRGSLGPVTRWPIVWPRCLGSPQNIRRGRGILVGRWVRVDRRYNQPYWLTPYAVRSIFKWVGLVLAWIFINSALTAAHLGVLALATTAGLVWYAVHCVRRNRAPRLDRPSYNPVMPPSGEWQFNPPPDWPVPPLGWSPEPAWKPDPSWPAAPAGWQFWVPVAPTVHGAPGERNSRTIPQDVKITVTVRDQGKCVQCGATEDLHFDHKIPWSRGGANTINNIQLLCGPCNRRKGADDIPAW
jgi:hypothetical protein